MNVQDLRNLAVIDKELQDVEAMIAAQRGQSPTVDAIISVEHLNRSYPQYVDRATLITWLEARRDLLKAKLKAGGIS